MSDEEGSGQVLGTGLRVLTLNVSRPPRQRVPGLLEYLWLSEADLLVLTEMGAGAGSALLAAACREAGYATLHSLSVDRSNRSRDRSDSAGRDELGVLLVGRDVALEPEADSAPVLLPHRTVMARVAGVRIVGVYGAASDPVRYSSQAQRQRKREWLAAFTGWLAEVPAAPELLIGDLNIVDPQYPDGLRYVLAEELAAYAELTGDLGYADAYRLHNPEPGISWLDHSGVGCRYDHALVRGGVGVEACELDPTPLLNGLTDHAALSVRISAGVRQDPAGRGTR